MISGQVDTVNRQMTRSIFEENKDSLASLCTMVALPAMAASTLFFEQAAQKMSACFGIFVLYHYVVYKLALTEKVQAVIRESAFRHQ